MATSRSIELCEYNLTIEELKNEMDHLDLQAQPETLPSYVDLPESITEPRKMQQIHFNAICKACVQKGVINPCVHSDQSPPQQWGSEIPTMQLSLYPSAPLGPYYHESAYKDTDSLDWVMSDEVQYDFYELQRKANKLNKEIDAFFEDFLKR